VKFIIKFFLVVVLFFNYIYANEYRDIKIIKLKKDEYKKILVKYDNHQKVFKFRWTLFSNQNLVVLHSYDRIVSHKMLSLRYKANSYRVELKTRGADFYNVPYILVKFKEFDYEKREAVFELFLSDKKSQVSLKYLKNN
jgi:hypothetical protein